MEIQRGKDLPSITQQASGRTRTWTQVFSHLVWSVFPSAAIWDGIWGTELEENSWRQEAIAPSISETTGWTVKNVY